MEPRYDDWIQFAEEQVRNIEASGTTVHKVYMDVDALIAWSSRHSMKINRHTRTDYSNHLLAHHLGLNKDV